MTVAIWLGSAAPLRSIRWLDGALLAAGKGATAIAAGDPTWLDLAADRATRAGLTSVGVPTDLSLDYLGWAQIVAAVARQLDATMILVDEASRPDRAPEVAAIAELMDAAQLTRVVALTGDGEAGRARPVTSNDVNRPARAGTSNESNRRPALGNVLHASRSHGATLQLVRIQAPAVIGVRIAGPAIDEYPTPMPSASMKRLDLAALGLDPMVLGHRALPPRASQQPRRTVDRVAEHLAVHRLPRRAP